MTPGPLPSFLAERAGGCVLRVRVIPRAGRSALAGERDGALLVRLSAAPVEGAANTALIELLADVLDLPRRHLRIASGDRSRDKRVEIAGVTASDAAERLGRPVRHDSNG